MSAPEVHAGSRSRSDTSSRRGQTFPAPARAVTDRRQGSGARTAGRLRRFTHLLQTSGLGEKLLRLEGQRGQVVGLDRGTRLGHPPAIDAPVSTYCSAKQNSTGCVPVMSSTGLPTVAGTDDFFVTAINVLTNKPGGATRKILAAHDLERSFVGVIGGDGPTRRKPHPEGLKKIQALDPGRKLWYVGDTVDDARCGKNAGVDFIGIAAPGAAGSGELATLLKAENAVAVLDDINQLERVL